MGRQRSRSREGKTSREPSIDIGRAQQELVVEHWADSPLLIPDYNVPEQTQDKNVVKPTTNATATIPLRCDVTVRAPVFTTWKTSPITGKGSGLFDSSLKSEPSPPAALSPVFEVYTGYSPIEPAAALTSSVQTQLVPNETRRIHPDLPNNKTADADIQAAKSVHADTIIARPSGLGIGSAARMRASSQDRADSNRDNRKNLLLNTTSSRGPSLDIARATNASIVTDTNEDSGGDPDITSPITTKRHSYYDPSITSTRPRDGSRPPAESRDAGTRSTESNKPDERSSLPTGLQTRPTIAPLEASREGDVSEPKPHRRAPSLGPVSSRSREPEASDRRRAPSVDTYNRGEARIRMRTGQAGARMMPDPLRSNPYIPI